MIIISLLFCAKPAIAELVKFEPPVIDISIKSKHKLKGKKKKKYKKKWKKACKKLGKYLQVGNGPRGSGIFSNFSCYDGKKIIAGAKNKEKSRWAMQVTDAPKGVDIEIFHITEEAGKPKLNQEALVELPGSEKAISALGDTEVASLVALELLDGLPASRVVDLPDTSVKSIKSRDKLKRSYPVPKGPKNLAIYSLAFDTITNSWVPSVVGKAKNKTKKFKFKKEYDPNKKHKFKQTHKWSVKLKKSKFESGAVYFAQSTKGRGTDQKDIHDALDFALLRYGMSTNPLFDAFFDTLASGYAGIRYGLSMTSGDPIVSKSNMIGIFTEVRGGPLEGLRWYWDFAPRTEASVGEENLHFEWSRPTFGWSFGLEMDGMITRMDAVPKIGWMNLDARVGIPKNDETGAVQTEDFLMENSLAIGIEVGIESQTTWFLMRLWGASDGAGIFNDLPGAGSITSLRGGIDAYIDLLNPLDSFDASLLVFVLGERISLSRNASENTELAAETGVNLEGLAYNLAFLGVGMTLQW